jgi:hypothetical protein
MRYFNKHIYLVWWLLIYSTFACAGLASPTFGGQPYFSAFPSATTQTVTSGANTKINFDTLEYDSGGYYDTTNKRYLPKVAGKYWVTCSVSFTTIATADFFSAQIFKNGAAYSLAFQFTTPGNAGQTYNISKSALVPLNGTTDFVECFGATTGTVVNNGGSNNYNNFQAFYLGP